MLRCGYEVDIMRALLLQRKIRLRELFRVVTFADSAVADIVILAVDTTQIAAGEKYRSRTIRPAEKRLLPMMQHYLGNPRRFHCSAETGLDCAVDAAASGAKKTLHQNTRLPLTKLRVQ